MTDTAWKCLYSIERQVLPERKKIIYGDLTRLWLYGEFKSTQTKTAHPPSLQVTHVITLMTGSCIPKGLHNQAPSQVAMITQLQQTTWAMQFKKPRYEGVWPRIVNYCVQNQSLSIHLEIFRYIVTRERNHLL